MTPLEGDLYFCVEERAIGVMVVLYRHHEKRHWWNTEWEQVSYQWLLDRDARVVANELLYRLRQDEEAEQHRRDQLAKYGRR